MGGGRRGRKEKLCCNANEHIYKTLKKPCFSLRLLTILEDVLVAVAQKALSRLLYFLI